MTIADALVTEQMENGLVELLKDRDPRARAGALNMIAFVGRSMRDQTPTIMKRLREDPKPEIRLIAARTLALVADDSILPQLQNLRKKLSDDDMKQTLKEAIDVLRDH